MDRIDLDWLRAELKARKISQLEFARGAGIPAPDASYVNKVLHGKRRLQQHEVVQAMRFLQSRGIIPAPGLAEAPLAAWEPATPGDRALAAHIATGARAPMYWALSQSVPAFALLKGDIVIVDNIADAADGQILAARRTDPETGDHAVTFVARRLGSHLWTGEPQATAHLIPLADPSISLVGPILGSFRRN